MLSPMVSDILLQIVIILVLAIMFLSIYNIPQSFLSKLRRKNHKNLQSKRHFIVGAQHLSRAKTTPSQSHALAKQAELEADKAILLNPTDAAAHILKALALELQGYRTSAIEAIDVALSPLAVKSLSEEEKADALVKRAEMRLRMGKKRGRVVDEALRDLEMAVGICRGIARGFCLLGECYEVKKMREEAVKAYEEALRVDEKVVGAREALDRLNGVVKE